MCLPSKVKGQTVQMIAVLLGNILNFNFGLTFGVTSSHTKLYESAESSPLIHVANSQEIRWMTSVLFTSAAISSLIFGPVSYKIGPKSVLLLCGLLQMGSWFCVHFAFDILHIISSRIFAGIAGGAAFTVLPLYISEICETSSGKASLNVSMEICRAGGILIGFILGSYVKYDYVAVVGIIISFFFSMVFPFVQESPYYFLRKGNMAAMEKSLRWFRGIRSIDDRNNPEFDLELENIKKSLHEKAQSMETGPTTSQLAKVVFGDLVLAIGSQLAGIYTILCYGPLLWNFTTTLRLTSEKLLLVIAAVYLFGTLVAQAFCRCANRRMLLVATSLISALCLLLGAAYLLYGERWDIDDDIEAWIMPIIMIVHTLFASIGFVTYSTTVFMENIPKKTQFKLLGLLHFVSWTAVFVIIHYYVLIVRNLSMTGLLVSCAISCFAVTIGSLFFYDRMQPVKEVEVGGHPIANGHYANMHI
ncbi:facilitated trehalose transporter Tret1 isoform X2 [Musca autumnalis]|uniref:facilitated trehalose transporter Tret1 isoform X2 n=1 Tax=Musca autumnalis TaxID=221902 RepID=UPI003CEB9662